jgi:hypothetical protein
LVSHCNVTSIGSLATIRQNGGNEGRYGFCIKVDERITFIENIYGSLDTFRVATALNEKIV